MKYRLLALDLDNTLLESDLTIPQETIHHLQKLIRSGVIVTLATGRMFPSAKKYADEIGTDAPLITYNGAIMQSRLDTTPRFASYVPQADRQAVIQFCHQTGHYLQMYENDQIVVEKKVWQTEIDPDLKNAPCLEVGNFSTSILGDTPKMMIVTKPEKVAELHQQIQQITSSGLYITASQPYLLEMMRMGISKTSTLQKLCAALNIPREAVICCGDHSNDMDMITWAGVGAAVGNAIDSLRQKADYVATASRSQGVDEIIHHFFNL